ncbi:hypothetical protein CBL_13310 [Carabus blaptoides fortunei]
MPWVRIVASAEVRRDTAGGGDCGSLSEGRVRQRQGPRAQVASACGKLLIWMFRWVDIRRDATTMLRWSETEVSRRDKRETPVGVERPWERVRPRACRCTRARHRLPPSQHARDCAPSPQASTSRPPPAAFSRTGTRQINSLHSYFTKEIIIQLQILT